MDRFARLFIFEPLINKELVLLKIITNFYKILKTFSIFAIVIHQSCLNEVLDTYDDTSIYRASRKKLITMKKFLLIVPVACLLLLASCGTTYQAGMVHTATQVNVPTAISSTNIADLEVGERVTFTYTTTAQDRAGYYALDNCKSAAIAAMLKQYGNADVIVAPEFKYPTDLKTIEVTGRPAKYRNFRGAN